MKSRIFGYRLGSDAVLFAFAVAEPSSKACGQSTGHLAHDPQPAAGSPAFLWQCKVSVEPAEARCLLVLLLTHQFDTQLAREEARFFAVWLCGLSYDMTGIPRASGLGTDGPRLEAIKDHRHHRQGRAEAYGNVSCLHPSGAVTDPSRELED